MNASVTSIQTTTAPAPARDQRAIGWWLAVVCAMTVAMVFIGGLTRLTHSGLSMTDWTFTGRLPPFTEAAWMAEFDKYKAFPEYQKLNQGMSLGAFKQIFWFEYGHRMLGRTIGMVFLYPALVFAVRESVSRTLGLKLVGLFVLLCTQGLIGWWMVKSGLVDRPDVSHYRLMTHLGTAFLFFGALLWTTFGQFTRQPGSAPLPETRPFANQAIGLSVLIFGTILFGALVAGTNSGHIYNTFPLMDGQLIPDGLLHRSPWYTNFVEHPKTMQFVHRVLAIGTFALISVQWFRSKSQPLSPRMRRASTLLFWVACGQVALGISTLLTIVWVPLASAHQLGALALFGASLWSAYTLWRPEGAAWRA